MHCPKSCRAEGREHEAFAEFCGSSMLLVLAIGLHNAEKIMKFFEMLSH
jgi:hypothetical protein